mmetsp:Transcript_11306/g.21153  ORF Transcript_11306/g.21153 Transcript_11306/m.21153 type:complete len:199 (-) Transcript_11306:106-702(-)
MEVLKSGDVPALVTNIEVMNILSKRRTRQTEQQLNDESDKTTTNPTATTAQKKKADKLRHRDFIETKVFEYLQSTPCANVEFELMPEFVSKLKGGSKERLLDATVPTKESLEEEVAKVGNDLNNATSEGFHLTDAEILQILNHMPSEPVEIHLMIEDLMSRMDEEKQNNLLQLIGEYSNPQEAATEEEEIIEEDLIDE